MAIFSSYVTNYQRVIIPSGNHMCQCTKTFSSMILPAMKLLPRVFSSLPCLITEGQQSYIPLTLIKTHNNTSQKAYHYTKLYQ